MIESKKHHSMKLVSKCFLVSCQKAFIGASVDNIRTCACAEECDAVVVEYKCPWKHRTLPPKEAFLTPEIGGQRRGNTFYLDVESQYYFQVQVQMFVCEMKLCDMVIWTERGIILVSVPFDSILMQSVVDTLHMFWTANVLPYMVQELTGLNKGILCRIIDALLMIVSFIINFGMVVINSSY